LFIISDYSQSSLKKYKIKITLNIKMITSWETILTIVIVGLSIVMPIYYSYKRKKNSKQDNKPSNTNEIKNYIDKINEITLKKHK
tara:strand:- start:360 stop:614 length:255 start_codon:yes stop_codon:yes gene_type:complete